MAVEPLDLSSISTRMSISGMEITLNATKMAEIINLNPTLKIKKCKQTTWEGWNSPNSAITVVGLICVCFLTKKMPVKDYEYKALENSASSVLFLLTCKHMFTCIATWLTFIDCASMCSPHKVRADFLTYSKCLKCRGRLAQRENVCFGNFTLQQTRVRFTTGFFRAR